MSVKKNMDELQRLSAEDFRLAEKTPVVLILDRVRSMHNVGSVFRSADAFRAESICLCGYTPTPPHRDIQKTALGATETVHWQHFATTMEAVAAYRQKGYQILSIEQTHHSIPLQQFIPETGKAYALVLGNEVEGVAEEVIAASDAVIEIPQLGSKHSLNISVSAGIVLWEWTRRLL